MDPILRADMSSGETWDDPSEDLLLELLVDVERGDETFVVVRRLSDQSDQTYSQVIRSPDGSWLLERRDGSPDEHYQLSLADMRDAHEALTAWAFELDGWQTIGPWEHVAL